MIRWVNRHTSMRGRLSMTLILVMVVPLVATGALFVREISKQEGGQREILSEGVAMGTRLRLEESVEGFTSWLDQTLNDLSLRLLRVAAGESEEDAFADLDETLRPNIVARVDDAGVWSVPAPKALKAALEPWLGERQAAYALLPWDDDEVLFQVVTERAGNATLVALRPVSRADGPGLIESSRGSFGRAVTLGPRPLAHAGDGQQDVNWELETHDLWLRASEGEDGTLASSWREDRLIGARILPGRDGEALGLALVEVAIHDVLPIADFQPAVDEGDPVIEGTKTLGLIQTLVGGLAVVGVLIAVAMGVFAPQWIWSDIRDSTDRIFGSVARLRELVGRNGRALAEQLDAVTSLNDSMGMLERESHAISDATRSLAESAEQSARVSETGNRTAEGAQRAVLDVRDRVAEISQLMEQLGHRTLEIGGILEFIDQVSEGTKKLSVNATIKASDPASAAKQLTFLAGEMRELAEAALDSTQDIEQRIKEIQRSSDRTLTATKTGRQEVDKCMESFEELEASFSRILRWVDETTQFARNIESSTTSQSDSLQTVAYSVTALRRRVTETEGNFRDIEDAIDELATLGEEMMEHWKVQ